jgi:hypothetical protein
MNEQLLEKLKKLLNLSKSANQHEAELALQKATAMATEAGIDLAIVSARQVSETEKLELIQEKIDCGKRMASLQKYASWLLKKHFNVDVVYSGSAFYGRTLNILGDKKDVEFAKFVNEFVQDDMQRRWDYYKKTNNLSVKYKDTFMYNVWRGLDQKLTDAKTAVEQTRFAAMNESERSDTQTRYGLVVASKKQAVEGFTRKSFPRLKSTSTRVNIVSNSTIAQDGFSVGSSMSINRPLSC